MNYCDLCGERLPVDEVGRTVVPFVCSGDGCGLGFCEECVVFEEDGTVTCPSCNRVLRRADWRIK